MNGKDLGGGICTHGYIILCKNIPLVLMFSLRILLRSPILHRPSRPLLPASDAVGGPGQIPCWLPSTASSPCLLSSTPASRSRGSASRPGPTSRGASSQGFVAVASRPRRWPLAPRAQLPRSPSSLHHAGLRWVRDRSEDPRHRVVREYAAQTATRASSSS